jgi:hypothetical protein
MASQAEQFKLIDEREHASPYEVLPRDRSELLLVNIEISKGNIVQVPVKRQDDPKQIAAGACKAHGISGNLLGLLADQIAANMAHFFMETPRLPEITLLSTPDPDTNGKMREFHLLKEKAKDLKQTRNYTHADKVPDVF